MRQRGLWLNLLIVGVGLLGGNARAGIPERYYLVSSGDGAIKRYSTEGVFIDDLVPNGGNELGNPQHMAVLNGKLYVAGYSNHKLSRIDLRTGTIEAQWSLEGATNLAHVRVGLDGSELWVNSLGDDRMMRVDPETGAVLGDLVRPGLIDGPHGVIEGPGGSLLVASRDNRIYRVNGYEEVEVALETPGSPRPTNMLLLGDGETLVVSAFTPNPAGALRSYNLTSGADLGRFSATTGRQADGLTWGHDGSVLAVFWGSQSIGRYDESGAFLGWFAPAGSVSRPNHIVYVASPGGVFVLAIGGVVSARRRRR